MDVFLDVLDFGVDKDDRLEPAILKIILSSLVTLGRVDLGAGIHSLGDLVLSVSMIIN